MTREEAINEIKSWDFLEGKEIEAIHTLIPELRESEDEKNANALIRLLNNENISSLITFEAKQQWLDWLERKKIPSVSFNPALGFDPGSAVVYHNDESEDERIRKALIDALKTSKSVGELKFILPEPTREECLAYLEKQKNLISYYEDKLDRCACENLDKGIKAVLNHPEEYGLEKQKEQKPAEWSEDIIQKAVKEIGLTQYQINWFKSNVFPPKPEWSEKEKKMLAVISYKISQHQGNDERSLFTPDEAEFICGMEDKFKSLRPQPKKELSIEKAIQWLDDTFYFLDNSSGRGRDCEITTHDFDSLEEMYDSFRKAVTVDSEPHWKPSEEQMGVLKKALYINPASGKLHELKENEVCILQGLLKQLEKL